MWLFSCTSWNDLEDKVIVSAPRKDYLVRARVARLRPSPNGDYLARVRAAHASPTPNGGPDNWKPEARL